MQTSELNFFKEILEDRKLQILKNIDGLHDELGQLKSCELKDEGDYASINNSLMVENVIAQQQLQELRDIHLALGKIVSDGYGTCAMYDDKIGFQRLKVKPHAIYCINCRKIIEKTKKDASQI